MVKTRENLSLFDLTNIVIGGIVGADIYVASALSAGLVGPFSIFVWLIAGIAAIILALVFAYSSFYTPKPGGPFSYASHAFDKFWGFLAGWSMWVAEIAALAVFPIVFTTYLGYLFDLSYPLRILVQGLFIFGLTTINIRGVKAAGKLNDALTIIKLTPLLTLIVAGLIFLTFHGDVLKTNYTPLMPFGLDNFGSALVLVFWAYTGFELATFPASETKNPKRTIPRAIILGILIVTFFYMATNFVVFGTVNYSDLSASKVPLIDSSLVVLGAIGASMMIIGALFSVSGSDEAGVLATARLSHAMSISGLFPRIFSRVHKRYKTPYMSLMVQGVIAFVASSFYGVQNLITFSVFNLAFAYLITSLSLLAIKKDKGVNLLGSEIIPWAGVAVSLFLLYSTSMYDKLLGSAIIIGGIFLYIFFSPKEEMRHLKQFFYSEEAIFTRRLEHRDRFLASFIRIMHRAYRRAKRKK
jgi:amino acid transporter